MYVCETETHLLVEAFALLCVFVFVFVTTLHQLLIKSPSRASRVLLSLSEEFPP